MMLRGRRALPDALDHPLQGRSDLPRARGRRRGRRAHRADRQAIGARVFGTVSTERRPAGASAGADEVIEYTSQDFESRCEAHRRPRGGRRVRPVGPDDVREEPESLAATAACSCCTAQSSGVVPPFSLSLLASKGIPLPDASHLGALRRLHARNWSGAPARCWVLVGSGALTVRVDATYPLERAADAHRALEGRTTTGKLLHLRLTRHSGAADLKVRGGDHFHFANRRRRHERCAARASSLIPSRLVVRP